MKIDRLQKPKPRASHDDFHSGSGIMAAFCDRDSRLLMENARGVCEGRGPLFAFPCATWVATRIRSQATCIAHSHRNKRKKVRHIGADRGPFGQQAGGGSILVRLG